MTNRESPSAGNRTYAIDLCRSPFAGILESGMLTFLLLIAIRVFDPSPLFKASIPASVSIGLIASPFLLSFASKFKVRATHVASISWTIAGVLLIVASFTSVFPWFLAAVAPAMICYALSPTFMIFAYANNYTSDQRGKRIASFFMISSTVSACFAFACGKFLDVDLLNYRAIIWVVAMAAFGSALCGYLIPSPYVRSDNHASPFQNIALCWKDKLFGWALLSWMFIGIANLMTIPLRVEYLIGSKYGIEATNGQVTLLLVVIPAVFRILTTRFWGMLFDRINLIILRSVLNLLFLVSILSFFHTKNFVLLGVAMAITGTAHGGGNIAWNLWVTKIAEPEKVPAYMSIHTASTGLRGLLSPFIGFLVISYYGPGITSWIASVLALVSIAINLPLTRDSRLQHSNQT